MPVIKYLSIARRRHEICLSVLVFIFLARLYGFLKRVRLMNLSRFAVGTLFSLLLLSDVLGEASAAVECVKDCSSETISLEQSLSDSDNTVGAEKDTSQASLGSLTLRYTQSEYIMNWFKYVNDPIPAANTISQTRGFRRVDDYISISLGRTTICFDPVIYVPYNVIFKNAGCKDHKPDAGTQGGFAPVNVVGRIRVDRKIVSGAYSKNVLVGVLGWCQPKNCTSAQFTKNVYVSINFTVPQTCTLNAGSVIDLNFGNISSGAFTTAGARAEGVSDIVRNVAIECDNIAASTAMTVRLQADKVSGNAVITNTNNDVGFVVADSNGTLLTPNNLSSVIPFTLDANSKSNITIRVYPVSVTGSKPTEGEVLSEAYLRVDFA